MFKFPPPSMKFFPEYQLLTIFKNHILDFSKINHFEKTWQKRRRGGPNARLRHDAPLAMQQSEIPMMNLFAEVDISTICEEVVESVFAGHVFQNITAQSFDMVPNAQRRMSDVRGFGIDSKTMAEHVKHVQVPVIFLVKMQNFNFITQPGAFRRIIMNLLGNALKYTSHGYVHVTLETTDPDQAHGPDGAQRPMVTLTVTDTGKGISSEFLRSKLFTPFTQENSLSSGTGLGLAIVKSIVSLLEGEIAIDSEVGRGTSKFTSSSIKSSVLSLGDTNHPKEVKVTLPLLREMPHFTDTVGPKSLATLSRNIDQSVAALRSRVLGLTVSLYGFDLNTPDPVARQNGHLLKESIATFLTEWYGLNIVPFGSNASIIIANDVAPTQASNLVDKLSTQYKEPTILVLCSHSSRFDRPASIDTVSRNIGFVAKPVGPLKLARALLQCLDGIPPLVTPSCIESQRPAQGAGLNKVFEELSPTPNRGEVLDNSRMSADSYNARKAIESPTPGRTDTYMEFPFPVETTIPKLKSSVPESQAEGINVKSVEALADIGTSPKSGMSPALTPVPKVCKPRLLLVDDNIINLTLLRTYMRKRQYNIVDEAENGLEAVNKFSEKSDGYDIIFMDISMPILDGFGASRQIRTIESSRRNAAAESPGVEASGTDVKESDVKKFEHQPALIIALTGLASTQDQSEALSSGIDLFLTKPVAFKEVGKLLDNWEANR